MSGHATAGIAECPRAVDAACLFSLGYFLEYDTDRERHVAPATARARDIYMEGSPLNIAVDHDPQSAAQTREAITRIIDPSCNQVGPREEDR
jgi:hypothetical protein